MKKTGGEGIRRAAKLYRWYEAKQIAVWAEAPQWILPRKTVWAMYPKAAGAQLTL